MIVSLAIKNYALIEDIQVQLESGLTTITGETGAGKSIVLGALSLLLGKRADLSSVKNPEEKCIIEAVFLLDKMNLKSLFQANDLDYDDHTIIRRELLPQGKSRAFVNDSPVTLTQLQAVAPHLVDIHSQHETLSLVSDKFQLEVIDTLAYNTELLKSYQANFKKFSALKTKLIALKEAHNEAVKELDYQSFLYQELVDANLDGLDLVALEEEYETLRNFEQIQEGFGEVLQRLEADEVGVVSSLKQIRRTLSGFQNVSSEFKSFWERANSIVIELEDLENSMAQALQEQEADPATLAKLDTRLQQIYQLQQKHSSATIEELLALREDLKIKVASSTNLEEDIKEVSDEIHKMESILSSQAKELHQKRMKAIPSLKKQLETRLESLGMPNAQFKFNLESIKTFNTTGLDKLDLLFTANKGLAFGPIERVASGGELSRIMLSIKAVLAKYKELPTLVFDEIDTGVSGEIATKIAHVMGEMSKSMQLLCITHLPQIAAKGSQHLKIYKEDLEHRTVTNLKVLDGDARIYEIAGMIGGENRTESALSHARELLN
ncbi:MAG TPA: DNA repair protein RecN [Flavobacteriaceae bacterium]|nr:DNA repair protein RecN [Flavobacteriaceae bacterium]